MESLSIIDGIIASGYEAFSWIFLPGWDYIGAGMH